MNTEAQNDEIVRKIATNYIQLEKTIVDQLHFSCQHQLTIGSFREEIWKSLFEQLVPKKFSVEQSVFIIDSEGQISNEIDLAIFDEQYTPYIFRYGKLKYIPIEAVALVVQCKSSSLDNDDLVDWIGSIATLKTSPNSHVRIQSGVICGDYTQGEANKKQTQTATRPLRVLCHLNDRYTGTNTYGFDLVIAPKAERLKLWLSPEEEGLGYWYEQLNHCDEELKNNYMQDFGASNDVSLSDYVVKKSTQRPVPNPKQEQGIALLTLTFQINQLLMLINNPMFFPHKAYVEMFNLKLNPNPAVQDESKKD